MDQERESAKPFGKIRKWHAGVESKIHALTSGNGMDVCRDKGAMAYDRYIAAAVMGRKKLRESPEMKAFLDQK